MKLKIVTPERVVLEADDVEAVYAQTVDGEIGILPKHVPLVTPLAVTVLRYVRQGRKQVAAVMGGILRTNGDEVSVLSDTAELSEEIDVARARQAQERAEARIRQQAADIDLNRAKAALSRSIVRIKAGETSR